MASIKCILFMAGLVKGAVKGFTTGALMFCAIQAISALSNAASSRVHSQVIVLLRAH